MTRVDGLAFLREGAGELASVWGAAGRVAWSSGEPLLIVGPQGVGKSTLLQQLVLRRLRGPGDVLGMPVVGHKDAPALYIAADRPRQIARSWRRMIEPADDQLLRDRLVVWTGPPPFDIAKEPTALLTFIRSQCPDARTVAIDSLKDVALDLSKDEAGARVGHAMQEVIAAGIELVVNHHQRKGQQGQGKPRALADVYGSTWITACAGSVILLWGKPGDTVVGLEHLKQPAEPIGPMKVLHQHDLGRSIVFHQVDMLDVLRQERLLTARAAAAMLYGNDNPSDSNVERSRRELNKLVERGFAERDGGGRGSVSEWRLAAGHEQGHASDMADQFTTNDEGSRDGLTTRSRSGHAPHAGHGHALSPSTEERA